MIRLLFHVSLERFTLLSLIFYIVQRDLPSKFSKKCYYGMLLYKLICIILKFIKVEPLKILPRCTVILLVVYELPLAWVTSIEISYMYSLLLFH